LTAWKIHSSRRSSPGLSLPSRARLHCGRRWRGYPLRGFLPCGSLPFGVFPAPGSYSPRGVPALEYVPSQRFARSQGLLPPGACRPCCMPVPPLGFHPSGSNSLAEPSVLSDVDALLGLACRPATVPASGVHPGSWGYPDSSRMHARRRRLLRQAPLQGLAPCERPCLRPVVYAGSEIATLVGFVLPREFSPSAGDPPRDPSSHELRSRCAG